MSEGSYVNLFALWIALSKRLGGRWEPDPDDPNRERLPIPDMVWGEGNSIHNSHFVRPAPNSKDDQ